MRTAICTIIKNEHRFLKEWIDWHLGLGFDAIYLFEDKGSDSHESIVAEYSNVVLRRYEDDDKVKLILRHQENSQKQTDLYNWFGDTYCNVFDWVAFIDIDEFITFADNYNLERLCKEFSKHSAVLLNWRMMGASGHIKRPSCGVVEAYTQEEPPVEMDKMYFWKSFCNLSKWRGIQKVHDAVGAVNTNHNEDSSEWCYDKVWINHYFTKSWEDWCYRIFERGGTLKAHRFLSDFFDNNPSMEHLRKELMSSVAHLKPKGTYWLDKKKGLICGGNINQIMTLNNKICDQEYTIQ